MQDPLKQGLKPGRIRNPTELQFYSNARSIKTRIETCYLSANIVVNNDSNARSIKTRIETFVVLFIIGEWFNIRMQDPLKQGLKLISPLLFIPLRKYSNARSIKTRIETYKMLSFCLFRSPIRMQDPLKQGLKQKMVPIFGQKNRFECKIH